MKVVIDDKIPFIKGKIETLVDEVVYMNGSDISADDVRDADILVVRTRTHCNRALLEGSSVRLVVTATIGYDHIDTTYLEDAGIEWHNCPGCNASSVCQYVHNSLLRLGMIGTEGKTVGVIGVGHVGTLVAKDLANSGLRVIYYDPFISSEKEAELAAEGITRCHDLAQIEQDADIVTFHTPLTRQAPHPTWHMADAAFFGRLRRRPVIINTSRGAVVDNLALISALDNDQIADVVIDVWEGEPDINLELLEKAVIATPHIAGYSADGKANATRMSLECVAKWTGRTFDMEVCPPPLPPGDYSNPLALYDPAEDTRRLKAHPEEVENLRGNYPLRREHA